MYVETNDIFTIVIVREGGKGWMEGGVKRDFSKAKRGKGSGEMFVPYEQISQRMSSVENLLLRFLTWIGVGVAFVWNGMGKNLKASFHF